MTTDPIAAARALIAAQPDLLFRCDLCSEECNCHPHHDMSMSGEHILCDQCEDFDNPGGVADPLTLIATLADSLEAEQAEVVALQDLNAAVAGEAGKLWAENQRLREALAGLELACDQLAATRSREVYLAMIDSGQQDALLFLDSRRESARAALRSTEGG